MHVSIVAVTVSNVMLTVFRRGMLGSVVVSWTTNTSTLSGSLLPVTGALQFPPQQDTTTITLTVSKPGTITYFPVICIIV